MSVDGVYTDQETEPQGEILYEKDGDVGSKCRNKP